MSQNPDDPNDPAERGPSSGAEGSDRKLDEEAAWREIVAHYGEEPTVDAPEPASTEPPAGRDERLRDLFQPSWNDPLDTEASWDDEGHFVPPSPPPMPVLDPRRRLAWAGLFGSPLLMLVAVVLGWTLPDWVMFLLAVAFAGGFVYLVATMPRKRGDGYDDGAVV
ncbi:hypothetical protein [Nocardioides pakistanensis]